MTNMAYDDSAQKPYTLVSGQGISVPVACAGCRRQPGQLASRKVITANTRR
jgi:hypothetical protein